MPKLRLTQAEKEHRAFRDWVNGLMTDHHESQKALADLLGITPQAVSAKMTGRSDFSMEQAIAICEYYGESYRIGRWLDD